MHTDLWGQEVTAANADAVRKLDETLLSYLGLRLATGDLLKETFAADPDMAMAHIARGYFMQLFCTGALTRKAQESLNAAEAAMADRGATTRERRHAAALRAWIERDLTRTVAIWEDILLDHPCDVLALRLGHFLHFYLGDSRNLRDSVARVRYAWTESTPGYGFFEGMRAFGLEETGDYAAAEEAGRKAVEINPKDIWATHAVAHVMEMQGRQADGIAWLTGLSDQWKGCNNFANHTWWHLALFHLERDEQDAVLELYDTRIRAEQTDDYLDLANAIALLARLELLGIDVGGRWEELADKAEGRIHDHYFAFHDAHYALALAATSREGALEDLLASMERAASGATTEGPIYAAVGVPLARGIVAWRRGEHAQAVDLLLPIRYAVQRIGGSHAQRDLFSQILIRVALDAARFREARALLNERLAMKPGSPPSWRWYAEALDGAGDRNGAEWARRRAQELLAA